MRNYLPNIVYAAVYLVIAAGFLFFYVAGKQPKLHKKWWVLLGALILLSLAGIETSKGFHQHAAQRVPSSNELASALNDGASVAPDDFLYQSPDGYQITIPKGLTYTASKGVISLIATQRNDKKDFFTLAVMKQSSTKDADSLAKELVRRGEKANPPMKYVFAENGKNPDRRKGDVEVLKNGVAVKTALLIERHGTSLYRVAITTTKDNFDREQAEIEKIFGSFKVL